MFPTRPTTTPGTCWSLLVRLRVISIPRCWLCGGGIIVIQKFGMKTQPCLLMVIERAARVEHSLFVRVFVVIRYFSKCVIQLLCPRSRAFSTSRNRTHRKVAIRKGRIRSAALCASSPEEDASSNSKENHSTDSDKEPLGVRDEVGHAGEPAFVRSGGHAGCRRGPRECGTVSLAFRGVVIAWKGRCGFWMCFSSRGGVFN